jgi:hypothetical protein
MNSSIMKGLIEAAQDEKQQEFLERESASGLIVLDLLIIMAVSDSIANKLTRNRAKFYRRYRRYAKL